MAATYWPLMRMTGVMLTAPILGESAIPTFHRVLMSFLFAICLAAWGGPWPPLPAGAFGIIYQGIIQIAFGGMIGLIGLIIVSAVAGSGEMAGAAVGANFAQTTGLSTSSNPPIFYNLMYWAGLMVYMGAGGMMITIQAVSTSFHLAPGGLPSNTSIHVLARFAGVILSSGVVMALPALAAALALNLSIGLANALAPALNIFSVGFPILFIAGIWIVGSSIFFAEPMVVNLTGEGLKVMSSLMGVPHG
jgi:flagellar biosynthetic protein FliR